MIPKKVYDLCQSGKSVSAELSTNPTLAPHEACKNLFGVDIEDEVVTKKVDLSHEESDDLEQARRCGKWGNATPSDLFLKVWYPSASHQTCIDKLPDISQCIMHIGEKPSCGRLRTISDG